MKTSLLETESVFQAEGAINTPDAHLHRIAGTNLPFFGSTTRLSS